MENTKESTHNLTIYRKHAQPPDWALKPIQAGRLKGKTDINPQWRIEALTDIFGVCGFGWKYTIDKTEIIDGASGEKVAFVNISLYVKVDNEWSEPIPGTGGSSFISNEAKGLYTSDEAIKMAVTDAISVACKQLGIAANIYSGSKYDQSKPANTSQPQSFKPMVEAQKNEFIRIASLTHVWNENEAKSILKLASSPLSFDEAKEKLQKALATVKQREDELQNLANQE